MRIEWLNQQALNNGASTPGACAASLRASPNPSGPL